MKPVVFIHTNRLQSLAAEVCAYSLKARSATPHAFDVRILLLEDVPQIAGRTGEAYTYKGRKYHWTNDEAQSCNVLRMRVPALMNFGGRALVLDSDVFALGDVVELLSRDMGGNAIVCRRHDLASFGETRLSTSVMLLDCSRLAHWNWDAEIDRVFAHELDIDTWLHLEHEDPEAFGPLEDRWNEYDAIRPDTRLLHMTNRRTQPWKTGLPIDWGINPRADSWLPERVRLLRLRRWVKRWRAALHPGGQLVYARHPDTNVERTFFALLRECLETGAVSRERLEADIRARRLRRDAFELLDAAA